MEHSDGEAFELFLDAEQNMGVELAGGDGVFSAGGAVAVTLPAIHGAAKGAQDALALEHQGEDLAQGEAFGGRSGRFGGAGGGIRLRLRGIVLLEGEKELFAGAQGGLAGVLFGVVTALADGALPAAEDLAGGGE